jgi:hypothetical protein
MSMGVVGGGHSWPSRGESGGQQVEVVEVVEVVENKVGARWRRPLELHGASPQRDWAGTDWAVDLAGRNLIVSSLGLAAETQPRSLAVSPTRRHNMTTSSQDAHVRHQAIVPDKVPTGEYPVSHCAPNCCPLPAARIH